MRLFYVAIFTAFNLALFGNSFGQEAHSSSTSEHHELNYKNSMRKHYFWLLWGNTIVPAAKTAEEENSVLLFPSLGLNYEFLFSPRFGIAWMNEFEMQSYAVEHDEHADIEREYPIITSLVFLYEPIKHLALFAGPGIEFEKSHNFSILKAGIAYGIPLPKYYGIGFEFSYELKNKTYDAWTFGILLGKGFGKTMGH